MYTSAMPVADFSKTEDVELDEGYNRRRPKEPRAKNIAAWTIPGQARWGIRLGYAGENDNAIKREHSVLGGEPWEYQRKIQRIINR